VVTEPKKQRGRPKGSKNKSNVVLVEPVVTEPKKQRGRPKGSKNKDKSLSINSIKHQTKLTPNTSLVVKGNLYNNNRLLLGGVKRHFSSFSNKTDTETKLTVIKKMVSSLNRLNLNIRSIRSKQDSKIIPNELLRFERTIESINVPPIKSTDDLYEFETSLELDTFEDRKLYPPAKHKSDLAQLSKLLKVKFGDILGN
jgi:hypothetical protein